MVLDIDLFRADKGHDPDKIRENAKKRFDDVNSVEEVIKLDVLWRQTKFNLDKLNKGKNRISKEYGMKLKQQKADAAKGAGDVATSQQTTEQQQQKDDVNDLAKLLELLDCIPKETTLDQLKQYREQIELQTIETTKKLDELDQKRNEILREIGNLLHTETPISNDEDENVVVRTFGDCTLGTKPEDKLKSHVDLIMDIDGMDADRGALISGSRGYFLKGPGWFLKEALINYSVRFLVDREYEVIEPPFWMRKSIMSEVAQLNQFDEELYKVVASKKAEDSEEKYLIATSEQPIAALHKGEWLNKERLPIRYCGISTCFRQEVGSHGRDTRGIFRVHQFDKVEQFILCGPSESWTHFDNMIKNSEEFYQSLGIPYRVVNIVSGALNNAASMKYDLEAWFPGSKAFRELVSVSNCLDYQARRLGVRYGQTKKMTGPNEYVHMLNGTMCATTRTVCVLLELYQTPEGIRVPDVLKPYLPKKYQDLIPYAAQPAKAN